MSTNNFVRPIPLMDYTSLIAEPVAVEPYKKLLFETKDSTSETGYRLRAKVRMTFAGLRTKNKAIYLPDEHFKATRSFTHPFPKPVQIHHQELVDPIGRVIDARYVDTTNEAIGLDSSIYNVMRTFKDKTSKPLSRLQTVSTFLDLSKRDEYKGVGYILGLWDITDQDAIRKILDGRYLTVSTGMGTPKHVYCSSCARKGELIDWRTDCGHERGEIIDGFECVIVPSEYGFDEVSPVNNPAAPLSQIIQVGENLSFADATQDLTYSKPVEIFSDFHISINNQTFRLKDSCVVDMPETLQLSNSNAPTVKTSSVIGNKEQGQEQHQGQSMKLSDLIKDTASNYEAIAKHLAADAPRLTGDLLSGLDDSVFIGPNRTFPVKDAAHAQAIEALLNELETSETRDSLLQSVKDVLAKSSSQASESETGVQDATQTESVTTESEPVQDSSEPAPETVLKQLYDETCAKLTDAEAKLEALNADLSVWKHKASRLTAEVSQLEAANKELIKDHKLVLAESLVDAQLNRGFKIEDRVEALKEYSSRSMDSLKDSIKDIRNKNVTGSDRVASGKQVADPRAPEPEQREKDAERYAGYTKQYWDLFYGPDGSGRAKSFWMDAQNKGLVPRDMTP